MSRPLPRYLNTTLEDQRQLDRIIEPTYTGTITTTAGGDRTRLRGIPVVGATTGTSPGTDPFLAAIRRGL